MRKRRLYFVKKIKKKKGRKIKLLAILVLLGMMTFYSLKSFNRTIEPQLQAMAKQHAGFAINNIVKEVLSHMDYDSSEFLKVDRDGNQQITSIEYDSDRLNSVLYSALNTIDASLLAAQDGEKDPSTKEVFYEDGILYEVPLGYFTHLYFLYDVGPNIKVRMKMLNDVTGEIQTEATSYGINSTLIKISLTIKVDAQAITFMGAQEYQYETQIPLVVQVVNGKVPSYTPYTSSSS